MAMVSSRKKIGDELRARSLPESMVRNHHYSIIKRHLFIATERNPMYQKICGRKPMHNYATAFTGIKKQPSTSAR
jgi:hypothetical protein